MLSLSNKWFKIKHKAFLSPALPSSVLPVWQPGASQGGSCGRLLWQLCGAASGEPTLPLQPGHAGAQHVGRPHCPQDQGVPLTSTGAGRISWNQIGKCQRIRTPEMFVFHLFICDQINMLLSFREEEQQETCPCPVETQQLLLDFHQLLNTHCGWNTALSLSDSLSLIYKRAPSPLHCFVYTRSIKSLNSSGISPIRGRASYGTAINQSDGISLSDDVRRCSPISTFETNFKRCLKVAQLCTYWI